MKLLAILAACLAFGLPPASASDDDAREQLDQATAAFEAGLAALEAEGPRAARPHFAAAADFYARIPAEHDIDNAAIRVSAGNAWLLAGRPGDAVLAYRRALRLDPGHEGARAGLAEARAAVGVEVSIAQASWRERAVAIVGALGPGRLLASGAALWAVAWLGVGAAIVRPALRRAVAAPASATAALGLLLIGAVAAAAWLHASSDAGVILAEQAQARLGPGAAAYEAAFDAPLAAGVEVRILERSAGWARVALLDGREAWIPGETVATINARE